MCAGPWRLFGVSFSFVLKTGVEGERWLHRKAGLKGWLGAGGRGGQVKRWDFSGQAVRGTELGSGVTKL